MPCVAYLETTREGSLKPLGRVAKDELMTLPHVAAAGNLDVRVCGSVVEGTLRI